MSEEQPEYGAFGELDNFEERKGYLAHIRELNAEIIGLRQCILNMRKLGPAITAIIDTGFMRKDDGDYDVDAVSKLLLSALAVMLTGETEPLETVRPVKNDCHQCQHSIPVPGNTHISCAKPDPAMIGVPHGIKNGWFYYPSCFDPTWTARKCCNFERREG